MRKTLSILLLALSTLLHAQTQSGYVRTVTRPGAQSQRIQGVVVRVRGDYNPVLTDEQGNFCMLMPGFKNGQSYVLGGVSKAGYELREPEIIGRQQPFSTSVPLEIVMVSRRQLQQEKQRIEQRARENIERVYEEKLQALNEQLAAAQLSNVLYEERLNQLEEQYAQYDPLIEQMADRYARTDYSDLDADGQQIQQAIEEGNIDLAQQLILQKGDPASREKKLRRIQREAQRQLTDLAQDYYHLYSIHLSRFQNDSALYYLIRRAELDTTNVQWQLDAGNAFDKMDSRYDEALVYFRRALRYALREGQQSTHVAMAYNNIAYMLYKKHQTDEAMENFSRTLDVAKVVYGDEHPTTAAVLMNIGNIHYQRRQWQEALDVFAQAQAIYDASSEDTAFRRSMVAANMAGVYAAQAQWTKAENLLREALGLLPEQGKEHAKVNYLQSLGAVCYQQGKKEEAHTIWQQAYDLSLRALGAEHPFSKQLKQYLLL